MLLLTVQALAELAVLYPVCCSSLLALSRHKLTS